MKKLFFSLLFLINSITAQSVSELFEKGMEAYNNSEYVNSYNIFSELISKSKVDDQVTSTAKYYLGESLLGLKQVDGAAAEFERFVEQYELSNYRETALYKLGTIYFEENLFDKSREKLLILIKDYPEGQYTGTAYYWVGETYAAQDKFLDAENFLQEAISARTKNRHIDYSLYSLAGIYEKTLDYNSAVAYYDELLSFYRESELAPYAQFRIGICYYELKEYDSAVLELSDPLIDKLPIDVQTEARYYLANSFFKLKEYNSAANVFNEILSKYNDRSKADNVRFGLGLISFQQQDYVEAYNIFKVLSENALSDTIAQKSLYWSAEAKRYLNQENEALKIYDKYLKSYPKSSLTPLVLFKVSIIYFNNKDYSNAEKFLIRSLDSEDETVQSKSFKLLGEISLLKKDYNAAEEYFASAVKASPEPGEDSFRSLLGLGVSQYYLNNFEEAITNLSDLLARGNGFEKDKANLYLAESYFAKGEFNKSLQHYKYVNLFSEEVGKEALYGLAYSYFNMKDFPNAVYYFQEYITKYKNDPLFFDAKLRLADSYYGTKNFSDASKIYKEIFYNNRQSIKDDFAYYQFAQSLFKAGNDSEAILELRNLQNKFPNSKYVDDAQYLIGWIYFQQARFDLAINNYRQIINFYRNSPLRPIAYYSIGDAFFNMGSYDSSIVYYRRIINDYPKSQFVFDAVNGIQYSYVAKDKPDMAVNVIDQYVASNPTSKFGDQILFKKGEIFYGIENYEMAKVSYKEFIATYPNSPLVPNAYYWIAKSSSYLNQRNDAIYNYNFVIDKHIASEVGITSIIELAQIYEEGKETDKAIDLYDQAINNLTDSPRLPELLFAKGELLVKIKNLPEAYKTFNYLINYYDGTLFSDKAKIELGILELERKSFSNSEDLFRDVSERRKDDLGAKAQYYYGLSLFSQEKINDAISAFVRVRSIYSNYLEWYSKSLLKLGDCYVKINDIKNARDMYRAVLKSNRNNDIEREARRKLNSL